MIYGGAILTPSNTPQTAPLKTVIPLACGMIYVFKLYLPPGSSGLMHVQVYDAGYQILPTTIGSSFSGDNLNLSFDENYPKLEPPFELNVWTWNLDTDYDHSLEIYFGMASKDEYIARFAGSTAIADLLRGMNAQEMTQTFNRRAMVKSLTDQFAKKEA